MEFVEPINIIIVLLHEKESFFFLNFLMEREAENSYRTFPPPPKEMKTEEEDYRFSESEKNRERVLFSDLVGGIVFEGSIQIEGKMKLSNRRKSRYQLLIARNP